ncbi:MAG: DUF5817 domain-containing protein [Haloferacaceae archaeon]
MYAVVGCNACDGLWLLADPGDAETATCPGCGKTHRTARLRRLFESEDRGTAREARATMLARRQGEGEAFDAVPSGADLKRAAADAGVDDDEYLERKGVDPASVAGAAEDGGGSAGDRASVVREAVATLDDPTEDAVVAYATDRGVPADAARGLLDRLVRRGEAIEDGGAYRLL